MKALMYGAGNIGRGFIAQLFYKSGYDVTFVDVNKDVINALNTDKRYPVVILSNSGEKEEYVENVSGIDGNDIVTVSAAIAEADIMATAVGVNILPYIAQNIAIGIRRRISYNNVKPLNIIICENKLDADKYLADLIKKYLTDDEKAYFDTKIGLVESSIGRMVPIQTAEMQNGNILRICVESYGELPVDKSAFKGEIPKIENMTPFSPFEYYIQRKLFIHNLGHAMTAYLGFLKGYEYIWQSIADPYIELLVRGAMQKSALALSQRHNIPYIQLHLHIEDLIARFANVKLGDTVFRVGRDLKRKLSASDRLIGAIKLCSEQYIPNKYICLSVAAALCFKIDDSLDLTPDEVLTTVCGLSRDDSIYLRIMNYYGIINSGAELNVLLNYLKDENSFCA